MRTKYYTVQCRRSEPHAEAKATVSGTLEPLATAGTIRDFFVETLVFDGLDVRFPGTYELKFSGPSAPVVDALSALPVVERVYVAAANRSRKPRTPGGI